MEPGEELEYRMRVREAAFRHPEKYRLLLAYGFVDPEPEQGTIGEFIDECCFSGPLDKLRRLAGFLKVPAPLEGPADLEIGAADWQEGHFRVFLSHHSNDRERAAEIKKEMIGYGIDAFVAHADIRPSKKWLKAIEASLSTADALVALVCPDFRASFWCDQEAGWALARGIPIVPLMLQDSPPHGFLGQHQAAKAAGRDPAGIARAVFETLLTDDRVRPRLERGLVEAFTRSGSYREAIARCDRLALISNWTQDMRQKAVAALNENSQCSGAFGVPAKVSKYTGVTFATGRPGGDF